MTMTKGFTLSLSIFIVLLGHSAHAGWIGHQIQAEWLFPDSGTVIESHVVTVGASIELPAALIINDFVFSIDLGDSTVEFIFTDHDEFSPTAFNGWRFTDLTAGGISDYLPGASTAGVLGVDAADLTSTSNSVSGNFGASGPGGSVTVAGAGDVIRFDVQFGTRSIPEPSSLLLLGSAVLGLGFFRRRRN
jgi:PEP-CTERM motif